MDFRHYCSACDLRAQCEHTFGAFFIDKSWNGTGCNNKIRPFDLARIRERATVVKQPEVTTIATLKTANESNKRPSRSEILERINRMRRNERK